MILGVIPARGGSKAIPRKNIKKLLGYPLIWWTIQAAKESERLDRFVVSTEDEEIAEISRSFGAEVIPRPSHLASDRSIITDVLKHILEKIKADIIVLLVPTSPVRVNNIIDRSIDLFLKKDVDSLATGYMSKYSEWGTSPEIPRQGKKSYFIADGCVYIHKAKVILSGNWYGKKLEKMVVPHYYNFDIDEEADFWAVEGLLTNLQRSKL
ncbi:MAG: acylneuraminate cytidylyltransferase family protein [Thermoplasmatales archaeon]|nr:acylneuraminate cytidylyltransferase family protein [Thermoplasmatales archaeon]